MSVLLTLRSKGPKGLWSIATPVWFVIFIVLSGVWFLISRRQIDVAD